MQTKKTLLVDIDDVCADLYKKWLSVYNKDYDDDMTTARIKSWDIYKYVKPEVGMKIYDYFHLPGFFRDLEIVPGTRDVLTRLAQRYYCVAVTNIPMIAVNDRWHWIREHIPMVRDLVIAKNKTCVRGDVFIDDAPHNLDGHPAQLRLLMTSAHNLEYRDDAIVRVDNWVEAEKQIIYWEQTLSRK